MQLDDTDGAKLSASPHASIVTEFLRAMPAAVLYPAEHRRYTDLADPLLERLRQIVGDQPSFVLEADDVGLWVMEQELPAESPGASEMRKLLHEIGVARLEIDCNTRPRELHALLGRIAQGERRLKVTGAIGELDFEDLPRTVRARRREFGRRMHTTGGERRSGLKLSLTPSTELGAPVAPTPKPAQAPKEAGGPPSTLSIDELGGAPRPRIVRDDELVGIGGRAQEAEKGDEDGPRLLLRGKAAHTERRSQVGNKDESADALIPAIEEGAAVLGAALEADDASEELEGLFTSWEDGSPTNSERAGGAEAGQPEAAESERRELEPPPPRIEQLSLEDDGFELTVGELRERIELNGAGPDFLARGESIDRCEELSIYLQLLMGTSDPAVRRARSVGVNRFLSGGVAGTEREIVSQALHELVATKDAVQIDATLPLILGPLRRSRLESIGALLLTLVREGPAESVGFLWPHVANELLMGVEQEEEQVVAALYELLGRIPADIQRDGAERVAGLEAIRAGCVAPGVAASPPPGIATLLAELIDSGHADELAHTILRAINVGEPSRPAEVALGAFATVVPSCRRLLVALLRDRGRGRATRPANEIAGRILVERMERLSPHERDQVSLLEAIGALGAMRHRPARPILGRILRERRAVILHAWSSRCRACAQQALRAIGGE